MSMTKMKPLHVEFCLGHWTKNIVFWQPCLSKDVLCLSILLSATERNGTEQNGTERNGTERTGTEKQTS
jgi:hypothetical protein